MNVINKYLTILIALIFCAISFCLGVRHAVEHSEIYVENDLIVIELDGQVYEHFLEE